MNQLSIRPQFIHALQNISGMVSILYLILGPTYLHIPPVLWGIILCLLVVVFAFSTLFIMRD